MAASALAATVILSACGGAADNKPTANTVAANTANTAATAAKADIPAPTRDAIIALEKQAWEAWKTKDAKFWDGYLHDKFLGIGADGVALDKAATIKANTDPKTIVKNYALAYEEVVPLGADAALLTYRAQQDYTTNGKPGPKEVWSACVYVRDGDKWKEAMYKELPIEEHKPSAKPVKPDADKKPDAVADELLTVERKAWDIWKSREQKGMEALYTPGLVTIDEGGRHNYEETMKSWFGTKCEIAGYTLADASAVSMTKDMSILMYKASADGTCGGQPIGTVNAVTVYVKDGNTWKGAFYFSSPA